jgi:hypothetical protein
MDGSFGFYLARRGRQHKCFGRREPFQALLKSWAIAAGVACEMSNCRAA